MEPINLTNKNHRKSLIVTDYEDVRLDNLAGFQFLGRCISHESISDMKAAWTVSHVATGAALGFGDTKEDAINHAKFRLLDAGPRIVGMKIEETLKKIGETK